MTNYGILLTYLLLAIATIAAIGFPIKYLIENPKKSKEIGIGVGALLIIYIISYTLASNEVTENFAKFDVSPSQSKQVGAGLILFYILASGAIISTLYSEFSKMRK